MICLKTPNLEKQSRHEIAIQKAFHRLSMMPDSAMGSEKPTKAEEAWSRFLWRTFKMWDRVHWQQMVEVARDRTLTTRQRRADKHLPALTAAQAACPHPISEQVRGANQHAKWVKCRLCSARIQYQSLYQKPKEPLKSKFERYMSEGEMAQQRRDRRNRRPGDPEAVNKDSRLIELAYNEVTLSDLELEAAESEAAARAEKAQQKRSSSKARKRSMGANPQQGTASSSGEQDRSGSVHEALKQMQESNLALANMVQGMAQTQAMATAQMSNQVSIMAQAIGSAAAASQSGPIQSSGPVHHRMDQHDQMDPNV